MFERFTDRARRVLVLAQEEARLLGHGFIGTEHILLGLIHEGEGIAAVTLESLGISLESVREKVEETIGLAPTPMTDKQAFTPRAKKVLELSLREALQLGHNYIGTEHMLLGLVREGEGVAAQVLQSLGADLPRVREAVLIQLGSYGENPPLESDLRPSRGRLMKEVSWPRHPVKVIAGPAQALTSEGIEFRIVGVLLYDDGIEVIWRLSGVPEPLVELLEDHYEGPLAIRASQPRRFMQRRIFKEGGGAILTTRPGFRRGAVSSERGSFLKVSADDGTHYISEIGDFELKTGGDLAGRSYFVPESIENERPPIDAKTLRVEWQGQSIEIDL